MVSTVYSELAMKKTTLTAERLRQIVSYDPVTGVFAWAVRRSSRAAGARAGSVDSNGYRYIKIDGRWYMAQQLAWLYVKGEWPARYIRFNDGNGDNCAIGNLAHGKWDLSDPAQRRAYDVRHRKLNPMIYRRRNLKRDFGISLEQYQDAFVAQGGVCACCHKPEVSERAGKRKWLAVDHDHGDNTFRGLLCGSCNNMLGRAKDDPEILRRAAAYLESHAAKPATDSNVVPLRGRRIAGAATGEVA